MNSISQRASWLRPRWGGWAGCVAVICIVLLLGCAQDDTPPADGPDSDEAWLRLENESAEMLVEVNLVESDNSAAGWGPNQLVAEAGGEPDALQTGETLRLRGVQPCSELFDLRAVAESGAEHVERELLLPCGEIVRVSVTEFP